MCPSQDFSTPQLNYLRSVSSLFRSRDNRKVQDKVATGCASAKCCHDQYMQCNSIILGTMVIVHHLGFTVNNLFVGKQIAQRRDHSSDIRQQM